MTNHALTQDSSNCAITTLPCSIGTDWQSVSRHCCEAGRHSHSFCQQIHLLVLGHMKQEESWAGSFICVQSIASDGNKGIAFA